MISFAEELEKSTEEGAEIREFLRLGCVHNDEVRILF